MSIDTEGVNANALADSLNLYINAVSGTCGLVVVGLVLLINLIDRRLMDRVSIRFTLAISFVDFLKAGMIVAYSKHFGEEPLCSIVAFSTQWLTLLYLFLNVAIAINLQLVFVKGYSFNPVWERVYWVSSFFMATILPTFSLGRLGSSGDDPCEYKEAQSEETCIWVFATYLIWIFASCAYCTVVVVMTIGTLRHKATVLDRIAGTDVKAQEVKQDIQRLIRRVALYCIIPVVTQTGFLVARAMYCFSELPLPLNLWAVIGTDIPGILNLIAFFVDPAFSNAVRTIMRERYYGIKVPTRINCLSKPQASQNPWPSAENPRESIHLYPTQTNHSTCSLSEPSAPIDPEPQPTLTPSIGTSVGRRGKREIHSYHPSYPVRTSLALTEARSRHSASNLHPADFESIHHLDANSLIHLTNPRSDPLRPKLDDFLKGL